MLVVGKVFNVTQKIITFKKHITLCHKKNQELIGIAKFYR